MADATTTLATWLAYFREKRGFTQEELARRAKNMSRAHLSQIERAEAEAGIEVLVRLADALGVTPGDLLKDASPPPRRNRPKTRRRRLSPHERLGHLVAKLAEGANEGALKRFATVARAFFPKT